MAIRRQMSLFPCKATLKMKTGVGMFQPPRPGLPLTLLSDFPPEIGKPTLYPPRGPSSSRGYRPDKPIRSAGPIGREKGGK